MSEKKELESPEAPKIAGHSYDGIEELDNNLPKWWINLFYITVFFSAGYFLYYVMLDGPTLVGEYETHKKKVEIARLAEATLMKVASESELRELVKIPEKVKQGREVFQSRCVSCHGLQGQGGIGPNLTDDYWIHGGKMTEIVQTISQGVSDKGMPPWGSVLSQQEIHFVAAYIKSIRGSNPPQPKVPQGILVTE